MFLQNGTNGSDIQLPLFMNNIVVAFMNARCFVCEQHCYYVLYIILHYGGLSHGGFAFALSCDVTGRITAGGERTCLE